MIDGIESEKRKIGKNELENIWIAAKTLYEAIFQPPDYDLWNEASQETRDKWFEYARLTTWSFRSQLHLAEMSNVSLINARNRYQRLAKSRLEKIRAMRAKT